MTEIFFEENVFENVVCKMTAILIRLQYVNSPGAEPGISQDN